MKYRYNVVATLLDDTKVEAYTYGRTVQEQFDFGSVTLFIPHGREERVIVYNVSEVKCVEIIGVQEEL